MPAVTYKSDIKRPYYAGHRSSYLDIIPEDELEAFARLDDIDGTPSISARERKEAMTQELDQMAAAKDAELKAREGDTGRGHNRNNSDALKVEDYLTAGGGSVSGASTPGTPGLSRTTSSSDVYGNFDQSFDQEFPVVDRLTMFDILENLALPQRLERMQDAVHNQAEKLRRQRAKLGQRAQSSKNVLVEEWRKRVQVAPDEQLAKYRRRIRISVDRLNKRWRDAKTVTLLEKVSFVTAVLNIFISGYLIGAWPEYFHIWYTAQLV